jgi:hypothetical protein
MGVAGDTLGSDTEGGGGMAIILLVSGGV